MNSVFTATMKHINRKRSGGYWFGVIRFSCKKECD